ncbi:response regulator [Gracilimonas sp.]|uniref:response regulator n=1 Tax=Gracilimonas sp. TaxID=1974203 RepID=UPI0028714C13|nr:response regulator [Gracilimonas sp.]
MNLIIVEDDKVLSLLLSKMIERLGYEVLAISTKGKDATQKIKELQPDLVLMDIMLEDEIDGIEVMTSVRSDALDIPVIYITGNSDSVNYERAQKTGFIDYLIKPVSFQDLKQSIGKV